MCSSDLKIYDYNLNDNTSDLIGKLIDWEIISKYIFKQFNPDKKFKVIIFYDSFLLIEIFSLYMEIFQEAYMIKNKYDNNLISIINPDYVFEFRIERFLL